MNMIQYYIMLYYITFCYIILCNIMSYYIMLYHIMSCDAMRCKILKCFIAADGLIEGSSLIPSVNLTPCTKRMGIHCTDMLFGHIHLNYYSPASNILI